MTRRPENDACIRPDEPRPIGLASSDRDLLLEHALLLEPLHSQIADAAPAPGRAVIVHLTPDDLDEMLGHVAFAANHADSSQLQRRFEELYDRLTAVEQGLDVQE